MNVGMTGLVLHLEDERLVRDSMAFLLRADGYVVSSAAGTAEALQMIREGMHPDVLIADFNLGPQITGAEVAEQMRGLLSYTLPIIMLTGDVSHAEFPRIAGAVVWLARKPLDPRVLLATLPGLVQISRATRNRLTQPALDRLLPTDRYLVGSALRHRAAQ